MSFRILGLSPEPFRHLFDRPDTELAVFGALRCIADARPGYPDRVELRDAEPGETLLLVNWTHQPAPTPYRSSHAIFVREGVQRAYDRVDAIPEVLRPRTLSMRAFDAADMMIDADIVAGRDAESGIERLLRDARAAYLHVHYAQRGCYAARVERA
jgi:hypothetical protein